MEVDNPSLRVILKTWLHAKYEKHLNPEMWRAHLYVGIGFAVFLLIALLPWSPPGVMMGVILATAVFSFHEYMGQRVRNLLNFLSSRYDISGVTLSSSSLFTTGIIVFIDLIVAVPMFGYGDYSSVVGLYIMILFAYWAMTKFCFGITQDAIDYLTDHPHPARFISLWASVFLIALIYIVINLETTIIVIESSLSNSSPEPSPPGSSLSLFLTMLAILIVDISILAVMYVTIIPIFMLFLFLFVVILVPYSLIYNPELLLARSEGMSFSLRLWATISILIIYGVFITPALLSWIDTVRNWCS